MIYSKIQEDAVCSKMKIELVCSYRKLLLSLTVCIKLKHNQTNNYESVFEEKTIAMTEVLAGLLPELSLPEHEVIVDR